MTKLHAVTTVQEPTESVRTFAVALDKVDAELIVIGHRKGPAQFQFHPPIFVTYSLLSLIFRLDVATARHLHPPFGVSALILANKPKT
jgi:hypothetical protein